MATVSLVALARPTFDVEVAQRNFDTARKLLSDLGATVTGPTSLIMTPDDVAAARIEASNLYILFMASFSDEIGRAHV